MNFSQLIVQHFQRTADRTMREVGRQPINEIVSTKISSDFTSQLLFVVVDLLDTNGTLSKSSVEELLEKKLQDSEVSRAMLEVAKRIANELPKEEREKLYNGIIDDVMSGKPDERPNT